MVNKLFYCNINQRDTKKGNWTNFAKWQFENGNW